MFSKVINDTNTGNQTISVPKKVVDGTSTNETWCENKSDHYTFTTYNTSTTQWSTADNTQTIANDKLREYLAGAYYKLDETAAIELLPGDQEFQGFSNNITDTKYVFRGVIDGSGNTIVNRSSHPLIVSSNGSVVYKLVLDVQPSSPKTLTQSATKPFSAVGADNTDRCEFYGAVMGQILGGDNIIDDVDVKFTGTIVSRESAGRANIVPIGGYVGVVVNGGLIFRNMKGGVGNNQGGISATNLTGFTGGTGTVTSSDNTKWLYINPIIGRVLNGYAVTESDSYKPFEDGSRTYPDGSTEYWQADGSVSTSASTAKHVTMQNGTKNYSIADINKTDTNSFSMTGITDDSTINISSAQALYIMSLITQCGLGKSGDGKYKRCDYLKPYDVYMTTHLGDYDEIGSDAANTAGHDYYDNAKNDTYYSAWSAANEETIIPYIIQKYTAKNGDIYPAFDCAGGWNGTEIAHFNLSLSGVSGTNVYLPDSYRGLGALMFGVNNPSVNTLYGENVTKEKTNLDNFKENVIFLYSLDGNNKKISINMKLLIYGASDVENYPTLTGTQANFKTGFALIDCLQSDYSENAAHKLKNLTIRGSVKYESLKTDGTHYAYTANNANNAQRANPAVSAFVGVPVGKNWDGTTGVPYDMYFENITVDSMYISGMCYVGGFVGAYNIAGKLTFKGCSADDLKVFSGGAAGGLIGFIRNLNGKIEADFEKNSTNGKFGIISIESGITDTSNDYSGAGGLIGCRNTTTSGNPLDTQNDNIKISNVTICNGKSVSSGYVGYSVNEQNTEKIYAGGIIGSSGKASMISTDHVTVSDLNIRGIITGGFIGIIQDANNSDCSRVTINNSSVTTTENFVIENTYAVTNSGNNNGASGGFIGEHKATQGAIIYQ